MSIEINLFVTRLNIFFKKIYVSGFGAQLAKQSLKVEKPKSSFKVNDMNTLVDS